MVNVDRVYIINLARRPDRLADLLRKIEATDWPFPPPIRFEAIDGDAVGVPASFSEGGGAFGCRQSHVFALSSSILAGDETTLILEDDADIRPDFGERWRRFAPLVPDDWEGIMIGGQHHADPIPTDVPGVIRVRYAQRTHAYIARGRYRRELNRRWASASVHIDWLMESWQHQFPVYAPTSWLIGQAAGLSDINGRMHGPQWWTADVAAGSRRGLTVAVVTCPRVVFDQLRPHGFHGGYWTDDESGVDMGLLAMFGRSPSPRPEAMRAWLEVIAAEAAPFGGTPAVWHPAATAELIRAARPDARVVELRGDTLAAILESWAAVEAEGAAK